MCVVGIPVDSKVSDQPINNESIIGANNRASDLHFCAHEAGIRTGVLIGIEGGYFEEDGKYYAGTASALQEKLSFYRDCQLSLLSNISETQFKYVRDGNDLNQLISKNTNRSKQNQNGGLIGFTSHGVSSRTITDKAIMVNLLLRYYENEYTARFLNSKFEERSRLLEKIAEYKNKLKSIECVDYSCTNNSLLLDKWILEEISYKPKTKSLESPNKIISWEEYFMGVAKLSSLRSKDPSTQVGACIVGKDNRILSMGYNGTPNAINDEDFIWQKDGEYQNTKYPYVIHAEQNAFANYKGSNREFEDGTIYVTLFPCENCAKLIVQYGIARIIYLEDKYDKTPGVIASKKLLDMCGVQYIKYDDIIDEKKTNLIDPILKLV